MNYYSFIGFDEATKDVAYAKIRNDYQDINHLTLLKVICSHYERPFLGNVYCKDVLVKFKEVKEMFTYICYHYNVPGRKQIMKLIKTASKNSFEKRYLEVRDLINADDTALHDVKFILQRTRVEMELSRPIYHRTPAVTSNQVKRCPELARIDPDVVIWDFELIDKTLLFVSNKTSEWILQLS